MSRVNLKNINFVLHHPSILKNIIQGRSRKDIRTNIRTIKQREAERLDLQESLEFVSFLKKKSPYYLNQNYIPKLNRLCYIEDWDDKEFSKIVSELQVAINESYITRKDWIPKSIKIVGNRKVGFIHRKDWEWALGIIAMKRFNKLNNKSTAIGIGAGREEVLFYLANNLKHVYATDIYDGKDWNNFAPSDFPENPQKYSPFPYREDALTVSRMDGTKLEFPSEVFDIAFSFSSIEHFGGKHHSGALKGLKEIERVLKKGGIAVIATEYIINDKDHPEFFNRKTIYSDLIDKLDSLKLVEPLDLRITTNTLDTVIDKDTAADWNNIDNSFRETHPLILLRTRNILLTSVMLVLRKE